jgi:hypothetical protein
MGENEFLFHLFKITMTGEGGSSAEMPDIKRENTFFLQDFYLMIHPDRHFALPIELLWIPIDICFQ